MGEYIFDSFGLFHLYKQHICGDMVYKLWLLDLGKFLLGKLQHIYVSGRICHLDRFHIGQGLVRNKFRNHRYICHMSM